MDLSLFVTLHERLGNGAPIFMIGLALLSFINYARGRGVDGSIIGVIVIGEIFMIVQVVLGLILWLSGLFPARLIHFLYGSLTILTFPALWVYTQGATDRRAALLWAVMGLFMMGLAFRAIGTAS